MLTHKISHSSWHKMSSKQVVEHWASHPELGLDCKEAKRRLRDYGPNIMASSKDRQWWEILMGQLTEFMVLILLLAGIVSGLLGEWTDTVVILFIVGVNSLVGLFQELKAQSTLKALRSMATPQAKGIRDGKHQILSAAEIVPGDLLMIEAGDVIPADLRWLETQGLSVDESPLTGESLAIIKEAKAIHPEQTYLADRTNVGHKGTRVTKGRGLGLVVATGKQTEFGKIAHSLTTTEQTDTPLQDQMHKFGKKLVVILIGLCSFVFFEMYLRGGELKAMFLTSIGLAVAAIPESLPAVVTLALSLGAFRLAKHRVLVRRLAAVEGLGSVNVICTDKTGTLTQNKMVVEKFWSNEGEQKVLQNIALLNNDAKKTGENVFIGDPTEIAIYQWAEEQLKKDTSSSTQVLSENPRVFELPFDSDRKMMSTAHQTANGVWLYSKGAPESIFSKLMANDEMASKEIQEAKQLAENWAKEGIRVLAFAGKQVGQGESSASEENLKLIGLLGLMDPPRMEVQEALNFCRKAHIHIKMITGDHPLTAQAIGSRLGIPSGEKNLATGRDLEKWSDDELMGLLPELTIFARVSPDQKFRLVKLLQKLGNFVAMTGDGVNDAPALKASDIGVSMGVSGTEVAKEASDLTLLDDNFATLINAVKEGRKIFDNLKKFLVFVLSGNFGEVLTLLFAPLIGPHMPLLPMHILWVNLVTDGLPGLALAAEEGEEQSWWRRPSGRMQKVLNAKNWGQILELGICLAFCTLLGFYYHLKDGLLYAQTVAFSILSFAQLFLVLGLRSHDFLIRSLKNPKAWRLVAVSVASGCIQFIPMSTSWGQEWLKLAPLRVLETPGLILILGPIVYLEIKKGVRLLMNQRKIRRN